MHSIYIASYCMQENRYIKYISIVYYVEKFAVLCKKIIRLPKRYKSNKRRRNVIPSCAKNLFEYGNLNKYIYIRNNSCHLAYIETETIRCHYVINIKIY